VNGPESTAPKLYIFPHAGGSVNFYVPFSRAFSTEIKRIAVQYPAQAGRQDWPAITSIPALADDIFTMLTPLDEPWRATFFGHSMGGMVAFEVARRFESAGTPIAALFVSACAAPGRMGYEVLQGSDREIMNAVSEAIGANPESLKNEEFMATVEPTLRSVRAIASYNSPAEATVSCPIYAFVGDTDIFATYEKMALWSERTSAEFVIRAFPGDHFYINANLPELVSNIESQVSRCCRAD
jgi:surfactin synthase thioesterase subunit